MLIKLQYKLFEYKKLTKFRVDIIVALTSVFGYLLGHGELHQIKILIFLFFGGFLVTATAHIINQIIEKDLDYKMSRTNQRPLVTGSISTIEAVIAIIIFSALGLFLLFLVSPMISFISFVSLIMYAFIYTPLKQISRLSIYIGAIPGALPILIGYVAATGQIDAIAIALFVFQVAWQLPHFWSIAWIWNDEYSRAGYDLMPVKGGRTETNAFFTFLSTLLLFPILYYLFHIHYVSIYAFIIILVLSLLFSIIAYRFYKRRNLKMGKKLLLASIIYLPIIQLILIINQFNL